jgi:hypothetical protein
MDALLSSDCPCDESISQCFIPMRLSVVCRYFAFFVILEKLMSERGIVQSGLSSRY